jgi:hypothetical protein
LEGEIVALRIGVEHASSDDIGQAKTVLGFALVMSVAEQRA